MTRTVRLGMVGFSDHEVLLVRSMLSILELGGQQTWKLVTDTDCDVLLLAPSSSARGFWEHQPSAQRPVLVLCGDEPSQPERRILVMEFPVRSRGLRQSMMQAVALLDQGPVPAMGAGPVMVAGVEPRSEPVPVAAAPLSLLSDQLPACFRLDHPHTTLWVDRRGRRQRTEGDRAGVPALLREWRAGRVQARAVVALPAGPSGALDALLWQEPLPVATAPWQGLARLRRWPSAELLALEPSYKRLCAALSRHACNAASLSDMTGIPVAVVEDFLRRAEIQGWLQVTRDGGEAPVASADTASPARLGLFKRIRQRLGLTAGS